MSPSASAAAVFALRGPVADLAELVWDGDLDGGPPPRWLCAGARPEQAPGPAGPGCTGSERLLCFERDGFAAALEVRRVGRREVRGQLLPPTRAALQLQRVQGGPIDLCTDEAGTFWLPWVPAGPVRLWVRRAVEPHIVTSWVLLD